MNIEPPETSSSQSLLEIVDQWNEQHGSNYWIRESDLVWNFRNQNWVDYFFDFIEGTPVIMAIASPEGALAGISPQTVWLSLWGKIENESRFVDALLEIRKRSGKSKLMIGGDEFHFAPGIPASVAGERLRRAFKSAGFDEAESVDYVGSLKSQEVQKYIREAKGLAAQKKISFSEAASSTDLSTIEEFLAKEFPGRWAREFSFWRSGDQTGRALWKLLRSENNSVIGFARMAVRGKLTPLNAGWNPGAMRSTHHISTPHLITSNDCCLGPIGVANSQRGQGTGKVLLGLVLESLQALGGEQICIDWTNAFKYYEPLNFELARRYWTAWGSDSN